MQWRFLLLYFPALLFLLPSPLLRPCMVTWATAVDLDLHAQLLSEELACDFNNITYCGLHNNGGWSFKQSLLELVQQLTNHPFRVVASLRASDRVKEMSGKSRCRRSGGRIATVWIQ
ncbi:hypothetical protein TSMEX_008349 [Taenia solium]|eukprot:TsM_000632500 transcript=TsM_000632500 gene=TsM_000632500